jgi:hypothetical protein
MKNYKTYYSLKDIINFKAYVIACRAHTSSTFSSAMGKRGNYNISYPSQTADSILNALLFNDKRDAIYYTENLVIKYICELRNCKKEEVNKEGLRNIMDRDYRIMTLKRFLDRDRWHEECEEESKKREEASQNG